MSEVEDATNDATNDAANHAANHEINLAKIASEVASAEVVLFMKGNTAAPQCGFSAMSSQILQLCEVAYHDVDVMANSGFKESLKEYSDWPTIPQLYIKGEFIGGCDIMREMFENGELQELLATKGVATQVVARVKGEPISST